MSELRDLYQELIVDHSKRPRNFGKLDHATCRADGYNPLCGDRITLSLRVEDDVVEDVKFEGSGCAISTASASILTQSLKGKSVAQAREMFKAFHHMVTGSGNGGMPVETKLKVFAGVKNYPARVKCATLAWHTLLSALDGAAETAKTE